MYQVIARKYRPQSFPDVVNQEHVKTTLENAIAQKRIAHGYIFSGQRGTGKTTVARILARCLNCVEGPTVAPCGVCASCREITSEAFNALLKTLEEPPEWVVFLLCTTESHKIPSTIVSRCQQFSFRSVDFAELVKRMEWIMQQEGITADADAVAVLARAGEGSVRDSLSALDQAIACCGDKLNAAEVRTLLGMFSLESLGRVTSALANGDSQKMFDVVAELEANGRSLQHFARELARHFRNLVVVKITGSDTRLVAASPAEQQKLAEAAQPFSEEDLTRYLQLSLDLFRDLQSSLQPRLHLEMGLLRMVQAGRLQPIEQALANLGSGGTTSGVGTTGSAPPPRTIAAPPTSAPVAASAPAPLAGGDLRSRLHAALLEAKLTHVADALEHSELAESPNDLVFTTPKMYQLYLKHADFEAAVKRIAGRPVRVTIKVGEAARQAAPAAAAPKQEDEATTRALAHPEVKRFQEVFPGAQVRTVRNLKDN
jgi:DNA polymerase-3 subunit gamma/tau